MLVRVDLARIIIRETGESQIIVLKERDGERHFPILIGLSEAIAIDRRVKGIEPPRPLTHDLMGLIIKSLDADLDRVVISDLRNHTFFATIIIRRNGDLIPVDARPSDAIALGVNNDTPLFVEESVLEAVCAPEDEDEDEDGQDTDDHDHDEPDD
jgi:hypothetical protein